MVPGRSLSLKWKISTIAFLALAANEGHRVVSERTNRHLANTFQPASFVAEAADGEAVFKEHCTPCHGEDGKGKAAVGTPDFTSHKIQSSLSDQDIVNTITNGRPGTLMPAWKGKLSTDEISAAASYVRSLGRMAGGRHRL